MLGIWHTGILRGVTTSWSKLNFDRPPKKFDSVEKIHGIRNRHFVFEIHECKLFQFAIFIFWDFHLYYWPSLYCQMSRDAGRRTSSKSASEFQGYQGYRDCLCLKYYKEENTSFKQKVYNQDLIKNRMSRQGLDIYFPFSKNNSSSDWNRDYLRKVFF